MDNAAILKHLEQEEARARKEADARWSAMSEEERKAYQKATRRLADKMQSSAS